MKFVPYFLKIEKEAKSCIHFIKILLFLWFDLYNSTAPHFDISEKRENNTQEIVSKYDKSIKLKELVSTHQCWINQAKTKTLSIVPAAWQGLMTATAPWDRVSACWHYQQCQWHSVATLPHLTLLLLPCKVNFIGIIYN